MERPNLLPSLIYTPTPNRQEGKMLPPTGARYAVWALVLTSVNNIRWQRLLWMVHRKPHYRIPAKQSTVEPTTTQQNGAKSEKPNE